MREGLELERGKELEEAEREGRTLEEQVAVMLERGLAKAIIRRMASLLVGALEEEKRAQKLRLHPPEKCKKCGGPADLHATLPSKGEAGLCLSCCPACSELARALGVGTCKVCQGLAPLEDLEEGAHRGGCTLAGAGRGN